MLHFDVKSTIFFIYNCSIAYIVFIAITSEVTIIKLQKKI